MTPSKINPQGEIFFLNLRFLLILCVFVGNAIEPLTLRIGGLQTLYQWIFTFHMPLFVFVTGYFAKPNLTGGKGRKIMLQIGLQYLIFQSLYSVLDVAVFRVDHIHHSFFAPYLLLWFLVSHLGWRWMLLLMQKCSPLQQLAVSILLAVLVGYLQIDGVWFSVSRTFVFLPFFVLGYHFSDRLLQFLQNPIVKIASTLVSLSLLVTLGLVTSSIHPGWLYGSMTYIQLGHPEWYAGLFRLLLYPVQLLSGLAFLGLVPSRASHLTELGRRTLYVFLLHGFIVRLAAVSPLYRYVHGELGGLLVIAGAVALTLLLAQPWVRKWSAPLVEPSVEWLLKLEHQALRQLGAAGKP
ncbi:fucose 4-O-acetylase [Paenibacillus sp. DXFW5]|uniref:Fucose 4-O-acetylase n=1 Tax=Paenibacillus rhizolycopersici TaxID=2780073 RepID=A0ABS2H9G3_9BACL|nr:fucose 4-O-acetylase [Paenibacillus rhizolycopersici]MBM6997033.1 fucose 4-O-acetylase [Paenibacillus rhizolycopersici]